MVGIWTFEPSPSKLFPVLYIKSVLVIEFNIGIKRSFADRQSLGRGSTRAEPFNAYYVSRKGKLRSNLSCEAARKIS